VKKRFPLVLALAVAFVLMMGSVAMAAPADTTVISNELEANIDVEEATVENVQNITKGQWYPTIAAAVAAANDKDILAVSASLTEDVTINKGITLQAAEETKEVTLTGTITITEGGVTVDGLNFIKPAGEGADSIVLNGVNNVTIKNCDFDANESMQLSEGVGGAAGRAVQMNNNCSGVTIDSCTFKGGYYVTIQGRANDLTVQNSEIKNCKSGINLQAGSNLVVNNTDISVKALGATNDTYCVRFASSTAGSGTDMSITGGVFNVDKGGLSAESGTYHSAIVVRAGAAGNLSVSGVEINGEVIDESGNLDLVSVLKGNTFNDKYVVTSRSTIEEVANLTDIIKMSWGGEGIEAGDNGVVQFNATQGQAFDVSVTADLGTEIEMSRGKGNVTAVDRVLYVIEVTGDNVSESTLTAIAEDNQQLGFKGDGCWYWGPPSGFTFDFDGGTASTTFDVTFSEAGSFTASIYAVRVQ
jgi:hypothetical protein